MDAAAAGSGQMAMLAGEPGIGKTRTAQELTEYAQTLGAQVWWAACLEQQGTPPYWPWVQPFRSYVQQADPESIAAHMGAGAADLAEIIPSVRDRLPDLPPVSPLEPEQARFRLFDSISAFLENFARSQPLMLVLDDLQWADQPSLLLLEYLAHQIPGKNILILGTYRDTDVNREHPLGRTLASLARMASYHREELVGLEGEEIRQLIDDVTGAEPSEELVTSISEHTDGNPFFMTEVIRLLSERQPDGSQAGENGLEELQIPQSVLEVIGQRLNRLSTECESILTTAAVIGREFDFELLGPLTENTTEPQILALIDEGLDSYLIQEVTGRRDVYQFSHALVQQTLRERLSNSRRVRLHLRVGETLEALYGERPSEYAEELAYHFAEAAPIAGPDRLVKYAMLAGNRALETYAHEEAQAHFERGLTARELDLMGFSPAPDQEAAALLFGLGRSRAATLVRQDLDIAVATLRRAFDFYAETNDVAHAVEVAGHPLPTFPGNHLAKGTMERALQLVPPASPEAGYLLSRSVLVLGLEEGDYSEAMEAYDRALAIAQRTDDVALEIRVLAHSSMVDLWHLRWHEAITKGRRAIELTETMPDHPSRLSANYWPAIALLHSGEPEAAQRHASDMLSTAKNIRDRYWLATAQWILEMASIYKGDWHLVRNINEPALLEYPSDNRLLGTRMLMEYEIGNEAEGRLIKEQLFETLRQVSPGPKYEQASAALMIPLVARITGELDQLHLAESFAAAVLSDESATPLVSRYARGGLGMVAVVRGDVEAAREQYANLTSAGGCFLKVSSDRILGLLPRPWATWTKPVSTSKPRCRIAAIPVTGLS